MYLETRDDLHRLINEKGWKRGVEIGVGIGKNAKYLLDNSNLEVLYGVDNWSVRNPNRHKETTKAMLAEYGKRFVMLEMDSTEAVKQFDDGDLDFVYIDGGHHYATAILDMQMFYPKVRHGGFFGGHDYITCKKCTVEQAVDDFFKSIDRSFFLTHEPNDGRFNKSFWIIK